MKYILLILSLINSAHSLVAQQKKIFDVCVVGANGGLGRELIYQSVISRNKTVLGLYSSSPKVNIPYRGGGLDEKEKNQEPIESNNLFLNSYWRNPDSLPDYKHIIFCTSAKPFKKDYSDSLTAKYIKNLSEKCKTISLISAYGVGDSKQKSSVGIKLMDAFYLKDVYRAKNAQENLINYYPYPRNSEIKKYIYRPKVLAYGDSPFMQSVSREIFAGEILDNLYLNL